MSWEAGSTHWVLGSGWWSYGTAAQGAFALPASIPVSTTNKVVLSFPRPISIPEKPAHLGQLCASCGILFVRDDVPVGEGKFFRHRWCNEETL